MNDLLEQFANTTIEDNADGMILVIGMILGFALLMILMIFGLRKCLVFGRQIEYSVISFNIALFAAPGLLFAVITFANGLDKVPLYLWIIIVAICWGIAIARNIIVCGKQIGYALAYSFFQCVMGMLIAIVIFSAVAAIVIVIIFIFVAVFVHTDTYTDVYNIELISETGNRIRARKSDSYSGVLNGEHGEWFEYVRDGEYRLISTSELYYVN